MSDEKFHGDSIKKLIFIRMNAFFRLFFSKCKFENVNVNFLHAFRTDYHQILQAYLLVEFKQKYVEIFFCFFGEFFDEFFSRKIQKFSKNSIEQDEFQIGTVSSDYSAIVTSSEVHSHICSINNTHSPGPD